jgi:hypothetical protein
LHVAKHSDTETDPFAEPIREETLHSALEIANHQIDRFRFVTASESATGPGSVLATGLALTAVLLPLLIAAGRP